MIRALGLPALLVALLCVGSATGLAAWSDQGSGAAAAAAATMPAGTAPTGSAVAATVTVSWPAVALSNGAPVGGYVITRINAVNGTPATVGTGCSGVIATTSCTELLVPSGTWVYTDTPVLQGWTGAQSPPSATITVP